MTKVGATVRPMLSKLLGLEVGPEEGLNEPVGKSEATKVGATLGPSHFVAVCCLLLISVACRSVSSLTPFHFP
jgi:hypothetical protein